MIACAHPTSDTRRSTFAQALRSRFAFCLLLAAGLVAGRLVFYDYETFFTLQHVPNHDMLAGAPFFCTNVHSLRTGGEIAWWNPISYAGIGYAQYYQSFMSPVAPTPGSLPFILWGQGVRVLAWFHIVIPEYRQYLIFTYVLLPFLAFFWFAAFASELFRRRSVVLLVTLGFAFSGVGLWYAAFLFFQEPATLFFLLTAWIMFFNRPTVPRGMLLLAALAVQAASINFWTVHNSWFTAVVLATHAGFYGDRYRQAWAHVRDWTSRHRWTAAVVGAVFAASVGLWLALIVSTVDEQLDEHVRMAKRSYVKEEALARMRDTREFTTELFNPYLKKALDAYRTDNAMHSARYIGMVYLPLLACLPFVRWGRRERWLAASAAGVLCVCIAPPFLLSAWELTPGMKRIQYVFYMYTHFWQIMLLFLAGAALDRILSGPLDDALRSLRVVAMGTMGVAAAILIWFGMQSEQYSAGNSAMEAASRAGLLLLVFGGALWKMLTARTELRAVFVAIMILIAGADLTRYCNEVNRRDREFTLVRRQQLPDPLPDDYRSQLDEPWRKPDPVAGFEGNIARLFPLHMELWPHNLFLMPRRVVEASGKDESPVSPPVRRPPAEFFATPADPNQPRTFGNTLIVNDAPVGEMAPTIEGVAVYFAHWRYSDFSLQAELPGAGWLRLYMLYDPLWEVRVDGRRVQTHQVNCSCLAFEVPAGAHRVELSYQPLARRLYGPACAILVLGLIVQGFVAWRFRRKAAPRTVAVRVALTVEAAASLLGSEQMALFSRDAESSERSTVGLNAAALDSEVSRRG